jgi:hypothetical protein
MFAKLANCKCYVQTAKPERRPYIPHNSNIKVLEDPKVFRTFGGSGLSWKGKNLPSLLSLEYPIDQKQLPEESSIVKKVSSELSQVKDSSEECQDERVGQRASSNYSYSPKGLRNKGLFSNLDLYAFVE